MNVPRPDPVTPYDRLAWTDNEIEALLVSGARRRELVAVFGAELYAELCMLAETARRVGASSGPRLWLVPGIMGSRLGRSRANGESADTIWLDPVDIIAGRLTELHVRAELPVASLGILHFSYLRLKLALAAAGYAVRSFDYDWRCGVRELGARFGDYLRRDGRDCIIVAHSMGGLVARCALKSSGVPALHRLVLLGTPNNGSWASVQALRGTYSVVRRLAQLDLSHDAKFLAAEVFHGFQCLYDLLPGVASGDCRLLASDAWPAGGLRPDPERLRAATAVSALLLAADQRFTCVAGFGVPTVIAAQDQGQFVYTISTAGDGTVAAAAATLPGARCYFARSSHSQLTRGAQIADAIIDIVRSGATRLLPDSEKLTTQNWRLSEAQLWALAHEKLDWAAMSVDARRLFLDTLNEPVPAPGAKSAPLR